MGSLLSHLHRCCWLLLDDFPYGYRHGGINMVGWFFKGSPLTVYNNAVHNLKPAGIAWDGMGFFTGGAVLMGLMTWARLHFMWWPLHPLGFALAGNHMMNKIWFNILIAWFIKRSILRYGGLAAYQVSQRFFLGLITGEVLCNGLWIIIDYLTEKRVIFYLF